MSLRDKIFGRIFGRREPIQRYGGIDALVRDIAGIVHDGSRKVGLSH